MSSLNRLIKIGVKAPFLNLYQKKTYLTIKIKQLFYEISFKFNNTINLSWINSYNNYYLEINIHTIYIRDI